MEATDRDQVILSAPAGQVKVEAGPAGWDVYYCKDGICTGWRVVSQMEAMALATQFAQTPPLDEWWHAYWSVQLGRLVPVWHH
jgi:hypothetical protein